MMENLIVGPNFRPFSTHSFKLPHLYFYTISLVAYLASWNEFASQKTDDV
jgi:hypothetical protein